MKCPCCGSTAQMKIVSELEWKVNYNGLIKGITKVWECGCGARTEEIFKKVDERVLTKD